MHKIISILKLKKVYIPLIIVLIIIVWSFVSARNASKNVETALVSRQDFSSEVSVTGKVVAAQDVDLSFEGSGKVSSINVDVGSKVYRGQTLATLNAGDAYASLLQSQARLQAERARLDALKRGARPEDLNITQNTYNQSKSALVNAIVDAYVKSDDALRSRIDILYTNPTSVNPEIIYFDESNLPYNFRKKMSEDRMLIGESLTKWSQLNNQTDTLSYNEEYLASSKKYLLSVRDFLNNVALAVNALTPNSSLSQSAIDSYKTGVSSARTSIGGAISSISSAEQSFKSAETSLSLKNAGSDPEDIKIAEANVQSAEASVLQQQAIYRKYVLSAPFDGVVTKNNLKVGESVGNSSLVMTMISNANFEIESFIPEADIAKVKVGEKAKVTLDAYGENVIFDVAVSQVELSETEVQGVATYKTTLQFGVTDERIKSGMTANVDIQNEPRKGVLSIPQAAIVAKGNVQSVMVMDQNGKTTSRTIKTGTTDGKGNIEITDGLTEGEKIVTNPAKK